MFPKGSKKGTKGVVGQGSMGQRFGSAINKGKSSSPKGFQKGAESSSPKGFQKGAGAAKGSPSFTPKGKGDKAHGKGADSKGKGASLKGKPSLGDIPPERQAELTAGVEAFLETDEMSWALSSDLTGLERKFIHQVAEEKGLSSQSYGAGPERYITLFKPAEGEELALDEGEAPEEEEPTIDPETIQFSGIKIDKDARKQLLSGLVEIPTGWRIKAQVCLLCKGGLADAQHDRKDFRSEIDHVVESLTKLHSHQTVSFKIVSVGKSDTSIVVGLLLPKGVMCTQRTPHITIAKAPDAPAMIASRSVDVMTWDPIDGPAIHGEIIQVPKGENYVEPAGEQLLRKRPVLDNDSAQRPAPGKGSPFISFKGKGANKGASPHVDLQKGGKKGGKAPPAAAAQGGKPAARTPLAMPAPKVAKEDADDFLSMLAGGTVGTTSAGTKTTKPASPVKQAMRPAPGGAVKSVARPTVAKPAAKLADSADDFLLSLAQAPGSMKPADTPKKVVKTTATPAATRTAQKPTPQAVRKVIQTTLKKPTVPAAKKAAAKSFDEELLLMCGGSTS
eukprot:GEMP01034377.1.p1 GENE.GEMP01034377.1~~GEMP01034377.1.p1  ORF type:complete len:574 (+),score=161.10 GEMP01034377.1:45-1724(+)